MSEPNTLKVRVSDLDEALRFVVKLRRKVRGKRPSAYISLEFDPARSALQIVEAQHRSKVHRIDCTGSWVGRVQVDGNMLRAAVEKYPSSSEIELVADVESLILIFGNSKLRLSRFDPGGSRGIESKPLPTNPKHFGSVVAKPDPIAKRVELNDTWDFSARVPMPQHRDPPKK